MLTKGKDVTSLRKELPVMSKESSRGDKGLHTE